MKNPLRHVVYGITCIVSGKIYVGSTIDWRKREREHRRDLTKNIHKNNHLQNAWNKHGADSFIFHVIKDVADRELLLEVEQQYLDAYVGNRYNIRPTAGNGLGVKQSKETIEKRAASLRGRKRTFTEEWIANISVAKSKPRKPLSEEHKAKVSKSNTGKKRSAETCAKLKEAWERRRREKSSA